MPPLSADAASRRHAGAVAGAVVGAERDRAVGADVAGVARAHALVAPAVLPARQRALGPLAPLARPPGLALAHAARRLSVNLFLCALVVMATSHDPYVLKRVPAGAQPCAFCQMQICSEPPSERVTLSSGTE